MGTLCATQKGFASSDRSSSHARKKHQGMFLSRLRMPIIYFLGLWKCPSLHRLRGKKKSRQFTLLVGAWAPIVLVWILSEVSLQIQWRFVEKRRLQDNLLLSMLLTDLSSTKNKHWSDSLYYKDSNKRFVSSSMRNIPVRALRHTGPSEPIDFWSKFQVIAN